jgi:hypothetical protein
MVPVFILGASIGEKEKAHNGAAKEPPGKTRNKGLAKEI